MVNTTLNELFDLNVVNIVKHQVNVSLTSLLGPSPLPPWIWSKEGITFYHSTSIPLNPLLYLNRFPLIPRHLLPLFLATFFLFSQLEFLLFFIADHNLTSSSSNSFFLGSLIIVSFFSIVADNKPFFLYHLLL